MIKPLRRSHLGLPQPSNGGLAPWTERGVPPFSRADDPLVRQPQPVDRRLP
ncbi:hypothetical protein ACFSL4_05610 [Streptomyces caeni]|uniref:Uncharacterized protein n=1 Tax=Streptomyces caeni TaxID=2307231 RepID=A0ABW4IK80_9ACTN